MSWKIIQLEIECKVFVFLYPKITSLFLAALLRRRKKKERKKTKQKQNNNNPVLGKKKKAHIYMGVVLSGKNMTPTGMKTQLLIPN